MKFSTWFENNSLEAFVRSFSNQGLNAKTIASQVPPEFADKNPHKTHQNVSGVIRNLVDPLIADLARQGKGTTAILKELPYKVSNDAVLRVSMPIKREKREMGQNSAISAPLTSPEPSPSLPTPIWNRPKAQPDSNPAYAPPPPPEPPENNPYAPSVEEPNPWDRLIDQGGRRLVRRKSIDDENDEEDDDFDMSIFMRPNA